MRIADFCSPAQARSRYLRVRFFKKIQDWILKSERVRKRILCFFITQINPRSLGSWCIKGTEESISRVDSSVPLMHHDPRDLGLICLIKRHKIRFRILSDLRIQSWIFLKKHTLSSLSYWWVSFASYDGIPIFPDTKGNRHWLKKSSVNRVHKIKNLKNYTSSVLLSLWSCW